MRPVLSEPARRWLTAAEDGLARGTLRIGMLPLEVEAIYHLGFLHGSSVGRARDAEQQRQLDQAYLAAYSAKDRAAEYQRRLDRHFQEQDRLFFAEPMIVGPAPQPVQLHTAKEAA